MFNPGAARASATVATGEDGKLQVQEELAGGKLRRTASTA